MSESQILSILPPHGDTAIPVSLFAAAQEGELSRMTIFTIGARRTFGFANTIIWCVRHEIFLGVASSQEILYIPVHSSLIQTECIC